jgi:molecular chaperone HtpG
MSQYEIKVYLPGLLKMLGFSIYKEPEDSVREMIQNAHDTCIIRTTKDKGFCEPRIDISYDKNIKILTFTDNGAGMTEIELHEYLATIGKGFTQIQRDELRVTHPEQALSLIGRFGIGLLSAFSVAKKVEILTRSYLPNSQGFKWSCEGDVHYNVERIEKETVGTKIILYMNDNSLVLLNDERLQQTIRKYADFLGIPIYLNDEQINSCILPWERYSSESEYIDYIKTRYNLYPLAIIPIKVSKPIPIEGILFVPTTTYELTRDFGEVDIYISRIFVKANDKELLPNWARFIKGIINTPELTTPISRNEAVHNDNYFLISKILGDTILEYMSNLEKNNPQTLDLVVGTYNNIIKANSIENDDFFDRISDLVRVSTSSGNMTMKDYLTKSNGIIYYFSERGTATQHKLLFAYKGLPVVDASWGVEEEFLAKYAQRKGVKLERADSGIIFTNPNIGEEDWKDLERQFNLLLHVEAKAVAFDPNTIPAVLVAKPIEHDDKLFRLIDSIGQELNINNIKVREMFQKLTQNKDDENETILHLNITNPLIIQLRDMNRNESFRLALHAIYYNAVMFVQHYVSPENAETIFSINNTSILTMIKSTRLLEDAQIVNANLQIELDELKRKFPQIKLNEYRSCFFAYPFQERFHKLRDYIINFLLDKYGIKLTATSLEQINSNIVEDIQSQISKSHFGIADITGNNPNVMWELGLMIGFRKPVIILKDKTDSIPTPFDVYGHYRVSYQIVNDEATGNIEYALLEKGLESNLKRIISQYPVLENAIQWKNEI